MSYFDLIKTHSLLSFSRLVCDIDSILTSVKDPKHSKSFQLLKKYIDRAYEDVLICEPKSLQNWKTLMYATMILDEYDSCFSDYLTRFGPLKTVGSLPYLAIDRLCEEILFRTGISDWKNYPCCVVFGGNPYCTNTGLCLIRFKATDLKRLWNWGIISHEIGHLVTSITKKTTEDQKLRSHDKDFFSKKKANPPNLEEVYLSWQSEIIADVFGTFVLGPSLLCAHAMIPRLWCFMEVEEPFVKFFSKHPPDECRYSIMQKVLQKNSLAEIDFVKKMGLENIANIRKMVDFDDSTNDETTAFEDRIKDIEIINPQLEVWLDAFYSEIEKKVKPFSIRNWEKSLEIADYLKGEKTNPPDNVLPSEILNGVISIKMSVKDLKEEMKIMEKAFPLFESVTDENILTIN